MFKLNLESIKAEYRTVELTSAPLFDENGSDSYTNQMIIGGKPSRIVNMNAVRHQWAVTIFNKMWSQMWQPQFVDMSANAKAKAREGNVAAVQSAMTIFMADKAAAGATTIQPTITELASKLSPAANVSANFQYLTNAKTGDEMAKTFSDESCFNPTSAATSLVKCVK